MPDLQRGRRLGAILRVTFTLSCAAALAWGAPSCADTGHRYDNCTDDAGNDLCHLPTDGGPILPEGFVTDPVVLRHDTGANDENDSSDVITFGSNVVAVFRNSTNWSADASGQLIVKTSSDQGLHWSDGVALSVATKDLREPKL
ncbi:MAG: hypothetical protein JST92_14375, partial [Deltaproteobacteria bacterium]|nr:hypothetical protein [Deltaproteobacteria bacterium]